MQPYIDYLLNAKGYTTKTRKRKHRAPIYRSNRTLRPNHYSQQRVDHAGAAERAELPSFLQSPWGNDRSKLVGFWLSI